jgi:hypothetical protein
LTTSCEEQTGPVPLRNAALAFRNASLAQLIVLQPDTIFPYSWSTHSHDVGDVCSARRPDLDTARCKVIYAHLDPFAIAYWSQRRERNLRCPVTS